MLISVRRYVEKNAQLPLLIVLTFVMIVLFVYVVPESVRGLGFNLRLPVVTSLFSITDFAEFNVQLSTINDYRRSQYLIALLTTSPVFILNYLLLTAVVITFVFRLFHCQLSFYYYRYLAWIGLLHLLEVSGYALFVALFPVDSLLTEVLTMLCFGLRYCLTAILVVRLALNFGFGIL